MSKQLKLGSFILLAAIPLALLALTVLINLSVFDEDYSPPVRRLMKPAPMPKPSDNAYLLLMGLDAASDKDPYTVALALTKRLEENGLKRHELVLTTKDYLELSGPRNLDDTWKKAYPALNCTARKTMGCFGQLVQQVHQHPLRDPRLLRLMARMRKLQSLQHYREPPHLDFSSPLPPYSLMLELGRLQVAERFAQGDYNLFLSQLSINMKFWRIVLRDADTLMGKMVATAQLWDGYQSLSEALNMATLNADQLAQIRILLRPLSQQELDIGEAFLAEQRYMIHSMNQFYRAGTFSKTGYPSWLITWLMQPRATANLNYSKSTQRMLCLSRLTAAAFALEMQLQSSPDAATKDHACETLVAARQLSLNPSSLYNLGGKLLLPLTVLPGDDYVKRMHDLEGVRRLVGLKLELHGVAASTIAERVRTSSWVNPYTEAPLHWDETQDTLSFDCLDKHNLCTIKLSARDAASPP